MLFPLRPDSNDIAVWGVAVGEATAEATDEAAEAAEAKKVTILSALDSASLCSKIKAPYSNDIVVWGNLETRPG